MMDRRETIAKLIGKPDEACECSHTREQHGSGYQGCNENGCACERFTWAPPAPSCECRDTECGAPEHKDRSPCGAPATRTIGHPGDDADLDFCTGCAAEALALPQFEARDECDACREGEPDPNAHEGCAFAREHGAEGRRAAYERPPREEGSELPLPSVSEAHAFLVASRSGCGSCLDGLAPDTEAPYGITRCDDCARFADDDEAAAYARAMLVALRAAIEGDDDAR